MLTRSQRFLPALLAVIATFFLVPFTFYEGPMTGFDPSWMIAIHMAVKNHSLFGPDFAFTYGPLAILRFRYPIVLSKYVYLLSDIFFLSMAFIVFRHFFKRHLRPLPILFMFCLVLLCMAMGIENWYFFFLFYYLIAFVLEPDKHIYLVYAGLFSAICLYIKVNSGIVDTFFFVATLTWCLFTKKLTWKIYALALFSYVMVLLVSAWLLHVRLFEYFEMSLHLIKSYNEVMWLPLDRTLGAMPVIDAILVWLSVFACCWIVGRKWFLRKSSRRDLDTFFCYGIIAAGLFVWYKQGFVRADTHVIQFYEMASTLLLLLPLVTPDYLGKKWVIILCWAAMVTSCTARILIPSPWPESNFSLFVKGKLFPMKFNQLKDYIAGFAEYDKAFAGYNNLTSQSNAYRNVIGNHTVDVIPTELSILYFNGLRYEPRPGLQSYSIYDYFLDSTCYAKYLSPKAPDYVLFSHDGIDERFPWTDEARTKLALIDRYRVQAQIDYQLVLKKRDAPRDMVVTHEEVQHVRLGQNIPVKQGPGFLLTRFYVHYDLATRIRVLLFQPPPLRMVFTTEDGQEYSFRTFAPILADGIILNKFVSSTREFQLLLLSDGRLTPNVRYFRIEPERSGGFRQDLEMVNTWYTFAGRTADEASADSLAIDRLAGGSGRHQPMDKVPADSDVANTRFGIETYADHGNYIRVAGWAIRENQDNKHTSIKAFLQSDSAAYEMVTGRVPIKEFPGQIRQRKDIDSTGFTAIIAHSSLPVGNYQVKLVIYDSVTGRSWSAPIDKTVETPHYVSPERAARYRETSPHSQDLAYNFDVLDVDREHVLIQGWAILKTDIARTPTRIILQNDTATFTIPTDLRRRPDIMETFHQPQFEYSGFSMLMRRTPALKGHFAVGVQKTAANGKRNDWVFSDRIINLEGDGDIPVRLKVLPPAGSIYGNFDEVDEDSSVLRLAGWALGDTVAAPGLTEIVLKGDTAVYVCPTRQTSRPDIVDRFKNQALMSAGFSGVVDKTVLPAGRYQVGLCVHDKKGDSAELRFFDRFIDIKK